MATLVTKEIAEQVTSQGRVKELGKDTVQMGKVFSALAVSVEGAEPGLIHLHYRIER